MAINCLTYESKILLKFKWIPDDFTFIELRSGSSIIMVFKFLFIHDIFFQINPMYRTPVRLPAFIILHHLMPISKWPLSYPVGA